MSKQSPLTTLSIQGPLSLPGELTERLLRYFPNGVVALDLETTGLSPLVDRVIEMAMIKLDPQGRISILESLVNPGIAIPTNTTAIHGITDDMVKHSPELAHIWVSVENFWDELPLIAHNGRFDLGFLVHFIKNQKFNLPRVDVYDSCILARQLFTGEGKPSNYKLNTLAQHLKIPLENYHRAKDDALACLMVVAHALKSDRSLDQISSSFKKSLLFNLRQFEKPIELEIPEHLKALIGLAENETPLWIEYRGGTVSDQFRPIKPLALMILPSGPVLNALCLIDDRYKNFSLKKIKSFQTAHPSEKEPK